MQLGGAQPRPSVSLAGGARTGSQRALQAGLGGDPVPLLAELHLAARGVTSAGALDVPQTVGGRVGSLERVRRLVELAEGSEDAPAQQLGVRLDHERAVGGQRVLARLQRALRPQPGQLGGGDQQVGGRAVVLVADAASPGGRRARVSGS